MSKQNAFCFILTASMTSYTAGGAKCFTNTSYIRRRQHKGIVLFLACVPELSILFKREVV